MLDSLLAETFLFKSHVPPILIPRPHANDVLGALRARSSEPPVSSDLGLPAWALQP